MHRFNHELVFDSLGQVLVHYAGRRLFEETHTSPGNGHDRFRVDIQWRHLYTTSAWLEGQEGA